MLTHVCTWREKYCKCLRNHALGDERNKDRDTHGRKHTVYAYALMHLEREKGDVMLSLLCFLLVYLVLCYHYPIAAGSVL